MLYFSTRFSAVVPIPSTPYSSFIFGLIKRHPKVESYILLSPPKAVEGFAITYGPRVIFSTPPEINRSPSPAFIARFACIMAESPELHKRFTVSPGTVKGSPASSKLIRATLRLSSPAWFAHPIITSSYASFGIFGLRFTTSRITCAPKSSVRTALNVPL